MKRERERERERERDVKGERERLCQEEGLDVACSWATSSA